MGDCWDIYGVYHPWKLWLSATVKTWLDITGILSNNADYAAAILEIFDTMPLANIGLLLAVTMMFSRDKYSDALTLVVSRLFL